VRRAGEPFKPLYSGQEVAGSSSTLFAIFAKWKISKLSLHTLREIAPFSLILNFAFS
jgi:hypothetical protein